VYNIHSVVLSGPYDRYRFDKHYGLMIPKLISKFAVGSLGPDSCLLTEGSVLRDRGVTSLLTEGGPRLSNRGGPRPVVYWPG
jgi:hypothetical protein